MMTLIFILVVISMDYVVTFAVNFSFQVAGRYSSSGSTHFICFVLLFVLFLYVNVTQHLVNDVIFVITSTR